MQSKSQPFGQPPPYFGSIKGNLPNRDIEEFNANSPLEPREDMYLGAPLHGDELMKALQLVGLTRPIRDIYHKLKRIPISYSTVYFAFYKDTYNKHVFEFIESLGVQHNRLPKKRGRPHDRDRRRKFQDVHERSIETK